VLDNSGSNLVSWLVAGVDHLARYTDPGDRWTALNTLSR
jgi:hypothetical protein